MMAKRSKFIDQIVNDLFQSPKTWTTRQSAIRSAELRSEDSPIMRSLSTRACHGNETEQILIKMALDTYRYIHFLKNPSRRPPIEVHVSYFIPGPYYARKQIELIEPT